LEHVARRAFSFSRLLPRLPRAGTLITRRRSGSRSRSISSGGLLCTVGTLRRLRPLGGRTNLPALPRSRLTWPIGIGPCGPIRGGFTPVGAITGRVSRWRLTILRTLAENLPGTSFALRQLKSARGRAPPPLVGLSRPLRI